jgi:hypothetical protein
VIESHPHERWPDPMPAWTEEEQEVAQRAVTAHRIAQMRQAIGSDHFKVYAARQNADLTEGRGGLIDRGLFLLPEVALEASGLLEGVQGGINPTPVEGHNVYLTVGLWLESGGSRHCNRERLKRWEAGVWGDGKDERGKEGPSGH